MGFFVWPGGPGKLEGINPRTKRVTGKGAEEAFFGAMTVGDDGTTPEVGF